MHMKNEFNNGDDDVGAEESFEREDWEDIPGEDTNSEQFDTFDDSSASGALADASKLKRRTGTRAVFVVEAARRTRAATPRSKRKKNAVVNKEQLTEALSTTAYHSSGYILDVVLRAMRLMRIPLSTLLFLWMLSFAMMRISNMVRTAFSPICFLPFISSSAFCAPPDPTISKWADFPQLMQVQSSTFEQLLDESAGGAVLALEIRRAEFATADLTTLVRHSKLKSNDVLADLLTEFVKDAKKTAKGLTRLSSKVGGAVDSIMAVNGYAMRTIEEAEKNVLSPYSLKALIPFHSGPTKQEIVVSAFTSAMSTFSGAIERLILEAEVSLHNLDTLEEDLSAIREVVTREDLAIEAEKFELLAQLWTHLGGNRDELRDCERRLGLLKDLGNYRKQAQHHVLAALQTLISMSEDMEDLRERVAAPELVDGRIPLHVHLESIQTGLERLQEGRVRAKEREDEVMRRMLGLGAD